MEGKDALQSVTNWGAIGAIVSSILITNGVMVDAATATAIISGAVTLIGRWKAGGIKSAAGIPLPQPKQ